MKCVDPEDLSMVWNDIFIIFLTSFGLFVSKYKNNSCLNI